MSGKTSFKTLLKAGSSNPKVNLQGVRAQRERLQQLKERPAPAAPIPQGAPKALPVPQQPEPVAAAHAAVGSTAPLFIPSPRFVGARTGYIFKADDRGIGYYRDGSAPFTSTLPVLQPGLLTVGTPDAATSATAGDALPTDFFDNPQQDPANAGKSVAHTRKEETLRQEMDEFNKLVSEDLVAAAEADVDEEEDEEESKLREAVDVARHLQTRVTLLRSMAGTTTESGRKRGAADAGIVTGEASSGVGAGDDFGHGEDQREEEGEDDDDDDDTAWLIGLDWRAKGT